MLKTYNNLGHDKRYKKPLKGARLFNFTSFINLDYSADVSLKTKEIKIKSKNVS